MTDVHPLRPPSAGRALALQTSLSGFCALVVALVWAAAGGGTFWPVWVWLGVGLPLALHVGVLRARLAPAGRVRALAVHGTVAGVLGAFFVAVWACSGLGTFWPFWPILGFTIVLALHALAAFGGAAGSGARERELAERVDVLTRTRRGALDVQAAQLRRIERDLHDGAQARLVALSLQLGRVEERLADRPEDADLVRRARAEAGAAIAELRDLARGIAPPVLADRGLPAAVEALGRRSPMPVAVTASLAERLPPVLETAAYFVVAESLTNAAKHAGGAPARVHLAQAGAHLRIEVADDGPGGADADGAGLTGLRGRVEALDGSLTVASPPGGGTIVRAELPCGS